MQRDRLLADAEGRFEGFTHVDDWVPQRLVTATGPNRPDYQNTAGTTY